MYFVYLDESGDPGLPKKQNSITKAYVIAAVAVEAESWLFALDAIKHLRTELYKDYKIRQSVEIKAGYLIHGNGPLRGLHLSDEVRLNIYRRFLALEQQMGCLKTWALAFDKVKWEAKGYKISVFDAAWQNTFERLERFTEAEKAHCTVYPDVGNNDYVRKLLRKMRRFSYPNARFPASGPLKRSARLIVEDPNFRDSPDSYFVQLADLNAYAASRRVFPERWFGAEEWDILGDCRHESVNRLAGGPPGIAIKP